MTPRPNNSMFPAKEVATAVSVRGLSIFGMVLLAVLVSSITYKDAVAPARVEAEKQRHAQACTRWHQAASTAVSRLIESSHDADLRQVNDSIFRMRRARRNCEAGWFELACQDYSVVAKTTPGQASSQELFACARVAQSSGRN
jgi:hypothetical protein